MKITAKLLFLIIVLTNANKICRDFLSKLAVLSSNINKRGSVINACAR